MAVEHEFFQLILQSATVLELEEILALDRHSFSRPWSRQMFIDELSGDHNHLLCVFQSSPDIVSSLLGFICFHSCLDEATLLRIAVHPDKRRKGIASFLIRNMMAQLKDEKVREIFLEVGALNQAAQRLYQSFHFQFVGRRPEYYSDTREDALIMKATL